MSNSTKIGLFSLVDHLKDPVTGQFISEEQRLKDIIELGILAENTGFERFAVGEHHFSRYILPNPNLILAAIAAQTKTIKLFTTVTLLAYRDSLQLAEDICLLDVISSGRLELSMARGVSFEAGAIFGVTKENVYDLMKKKLDELIQILQTASLPQNLGSHLKVYPQTLQKPYPPIWIGGGLNEKSRGLAISNALPLILPSLFKYPQDYLPYLKEYRNGMKKNDNECKIKVALPSYCWVARDSQSAKKQWKPRLENYVEFAKNLRRGFGRPMDFEGILKGPAICGSPSEVVDRISEINEILDLDNHILIMDVGGMPQNNLKQALELMEKDVLPNFH